MSNNIKILDCTLRDGGYVNGWDFGKKCILNIFDNLNKSAVDFVECVFLQDTEPNTYRTLYNEIPDINILYEYKTCSNITAMIIYGQFSQDKIIPKTNNILLDSIRVTFKKHEINAAFDFLKKIKECGYNVFVNPTNIDAYTDKELLDLIDRLNILSPYGFSIVDTKGILKEKDLLRLYYIIENNLSDNIALCFHSHNNLQLSFSNAQCLMKICKKRELIIDSTVFGMGRGAGNLCTELLTQYINDNYNGKYKILPILKIIDEQINPIFAKNPWGYSVPYYLAAVNQCHPNYAKYIIDKQTVPVEIINSILQLIPNSKKTYYDNDLIKQIYLDKVSKSFNDDFAVNKISEILRNRPILVIASGNSITDEYDKISDFIRENNPYIISLNFIPDNINPNMTFISNLKRFAQIKDYSTTDLLVITSNISSELKDALILNYSSYLNHSQLFDNVALMIFNFLIKINVNSVYVAGLDGYSLTQSKNYANERLINYMNYELMEEYNNTMDKELSEISKKIEIKFLTSSKYEIAKNAQFKVQI